jgi:hypothetical protein
MVLRKSRHERIFVEQRGRIYFRELGETAVLVLLVLIFAQVVEKGWPTARAQQRMLLFLTVLDLWVLGRHSLIDVAPWKPLTEQSPVLSSLAREPRGTRIADRRLRNMPMTAGLAPIAAYRTLDLPAVGSLTELALQPLNIPQIEADVRAALRATGAGIRLIEPIENQVAPALGRAKVAPVLIDDPVLAAALFEGAWVKEHGAWARQFAIWRPDEPPARAWFIGERGVDEKMFVGDWSGDPRDILRVFEHAKPLVSESRTPEESTISVDADERGWVIVTQLADPQWQAQWSSPEVSRKFDDTLRPAFRRANEAGGWQCVEVPAPGRWILRLEYEAKDSMIGLGVSIIAWAGWVIAVGRMSYTNWRSKIVFSRNRMENAT